MPRLGPLYTGIHCSKIDNAHHFVSAEMISTVCSVIKLLDLSLTSH